MSTPTFDQVFNSNIISVNDIRDSILVGFAFFVISFYFCYGKKSYFDSIAARKVSIIVRYISVLESIWLVPLLYCVASLGSPIVLSPSTAYGNGNSWIYGYGRPSLGIVFMIFGVISSMHPIPRIMCIFGCIQEIFFDSISAFQVRDYYNQIQNNLAPQSRNYTTQMLLLYYYRDIVSIAICSYLLMMSISLTIIVGVCYPQIIPYGLIGGQDLDRCEIMRQQSKIKKYSDDREFQEQHEMKENKELINIIRRKKERKERRKKDYEEEMQRNSTQDATMMSDIQYAGGGKALKSTHLKANNSDGELEGNV